MNWQEVKVKIAKEAAEAVAHYLQENSKHGVVVKENEDYMEITAYYPADDSFSKSLRDLKEWVKDLKKFGLETGKVKYCLQLTAEEDWATSWQSFFKPLYLGDRFLICPGWEDCDDDERIIIKIDPGMAFGVGSHETTELSIQLLEKYISTQTVKMLDIGTGTGILSIVAAHLGVDNILGIDIDRAAVKAARENIVINNVSDNVTVIQGDLTEGISGRFPLIIANLLPDIIERLLKTVVSLMEREGLLILSGIIDTKKDKIINLARGEGLSVIEQCSLGEWVSLVLGKD